MKDEKRIVWLASYPKSGNTWFRVFLANLFSGKDEPVSINQVDSSVISSSRDIFEEYLVLPSTEFTYDEIDMLRPDMYREYAKEKANTPYVKVHDAYTFLPDGRPLFPEDISKGVINFIRNPLDVAVSFAHHNAQEVGRTIQLMNDQTGALCKKEDRFFNQLRQKMLTWSGHVKSWTSQKENPLHLMRYEDMKSDTFRTFDQALHFLGLEYSREEIEKALYFSRFEELQKQEQQEGFGEKNPKAESFFRKGALNDWKNVLTKEQIEAILQEHEQVMQEFGYMRDKLV